MNPIKFFDQTADDDVQRIAIVEYTDDSALTKFNADDEIAPRRLPRNFAHWQTYTAYALFGATVVVVSRDGA